MLTSLLLILIWARLFHYLDVCITYAGYRKPYYAVHVIHNAAIVAVTAPDLWYSVTQQSTPISWAAVFLCYGLHLYYLTDYYREFRFDDWLHHGLMIGVALPLGSVVPAGALMGCNLFFTTGLPGAISYGLLFAERNKLVDTMTAKTYNAATNLWLRAPGCVAQAALTASYILSSDQITSFQMLCGLLIAILTAWNGLYFMNQAIRSKWDAQADVNSNARAIANQ